MYKYIALALLSAPLVAFSMDNDSSFFKDAAEGGIAEVSAGKLALEKGSSQAVKDFGAMMVKDHMAANEKLTSIAVSQSISLPTSASIMQMASEKKMQMLSGSSFDESYLKDQIKAHEDTVALFKKEIASGQNPQAKAFASSTLPTVQAHLMKVKGIAQQAGVKTN